MKSYFLIQKDMKNIIPHIKKEAEGLFAVSRGSHDRDHSMRVRNVCLHIGQKENADLEVLEIAALLHDVARHIQDESHGKICHAEKWAEMAREILTKYDVPQDKIDQIVHCIETHRSRWTKIPVSLEAKILFDADKIDCIWATGIGRTFLFAWEIGSKFHVKDIDLENSKSYTKDDTAYREYMIKLRYIKDKIYTEEGRRIAEARHNFMAEFFDRLNNEVDWIW